MSSVTKAAGERLMPVTCSPYLSPRRTATFGAAPTWRSSAPHRIRVSFRIHGPHSAVRRVSKGGKRHEYGGLQANAIRFS